MAYNNNWNNLSYSIKGSLLGVIYHPCFNTGKYKVTNLWHWLYMLMYNNYEYNKNYNNNRTYYGQWHGSFEFATAVIYLFCNKNICNR